MSLEAIAHRPSSSSSKEHLYSSEREASSRLAARLERSEYKRSRGKQRLHYHGSSGRSGRRRDNHRDNYGQNGNMERGSRRDRRENDRSMREAPFYDSRHDAHPFYGNSDPKVNRNNARPQSWFGATTTERQSKERPQSIHEISLDRSNEGSAFQPENDYPRVPYEQRHFKRGTRPERNSAGSRNGRQNQPELSRSLSSSFSSQVGSSADEREDHQGVYSAYDMTGRSPYGSLVLRRYSQSSLSSSSASWQQSSTSLSHHAAKAQWGSGSLGSGSPEKAHGHRDSHHRQTVHKAVFIKSPPRIPEVMSTANATFVTTAQPHRSSSNYRIRVNAVPHQSRNSHVQAQATPYSSGHHVTQSVPSRSYGHDVMDSSVGVTQAIQDVMQVSSTSLQSARSPMGHEDDQNLSPSVRDLAKRFSGNSGFFSEAFEEFDEYDYRDMRRVKAQTWPKFACVHAAKDHRHKDVDEEEVFDVAPPKPPYPQGDEEDFELIHTRVESGVTRTEPEILLRASEKGYVLSASGQLSFNESAKNSNDLAAHRLSLQELIRLHEDQIAKHAKSAQATAHAQIYLKRPEYKNWNSQSPQWSPPPESKKEERWHYTEDDVSWGGMMRQGSSSQGGIVNRGNENRAPPIVAHYELTELQSAKGAPIKVVEVTERGSKDELRDRPSVKAKRHRTIGVVGFRQQIDRVSEGQAESKPKRHTAIGIVSVKAVATTTRQLAKEEPVVVSHANYGGHVGHAIGEQALDSLDAAQRERHSTPQELQMEDKDRRVVKRTCKEFDFQAAEPPVARADFPEDHVDEEVFERVEALPQFARPDEVVEVTPGSEHDREHEEATKTAEGVTRIVVASPEKPSKPFEAVESKSSNVPHFYRSDSSQLWSVPVSSRVYGHSKHYTVSKAVPVAQVSPVSPTLEQNSRNSLTKESLTDSSPFSRSQSAREMYETRLALWNLYPPDTNQEVRNSSNTPRPQTALANETERSRSTLGKASELPEQAAKIHEVEAKAEARIAARKDLEEHYLSCIEKLKNENKELITKYEAEKREFRQKYEEQRKVANAYQKLEDRYRRRVHELQEALAGCTCQSSFVRQNKMTHSTSIRSDKDGDRSTTTSSIKGMKIIGDLEDWLSEQSKDNSASKKNNTTLGRNSLVSSSSDMTGAAWDELYDLLGGTGEIDYENGTHV